MTKATFGVGGTEGAPCSLCWGQERATLQVAPAAEQIS